MKLYSTKNKTTTVDLKEAVLNSLPPDNGLYMPIEFPQLPKEFIKGIEQYSLPEIGKQVCYSLFGDYIPKDAVDKIIEGAINFAAPSVELNADTSILELWHGPTLAFKDFGARFMAALMGYFNANENEELTILVATSGDTGGAVASGFLGTPGINVKILYPSGKVSELQEKQLTTLGQNIEAYEIDGTFDDCQAIVKEAFLDKDLNQKMRLSSANSINIARLIPQSFYYFEAWKDAKKKTNKEINFVIPSGNYGNLTAGLLANKMGLPINKFIAATNINDVVPHYLNTGKYSPKRSVSTISNAMDVGAPSNYQRMNDLFDGEHSSFTEMIRGYAVHDSMTRDEMKKVYDQYKYIIDPHGAVGINAWNALKTKDQYGIVLETAHPSKFIDEVESTLNIKIDIPQRLAELKNRQKVAIKMKNDYSTFKERLLS